MSIFFFFFLCDDQFCQVENIFFYLPLLILYFSFSCVAATLVSLIETRKSSIELCHDKKKNLITIVQPSCMMCERGKIEKEREISRSHFFSHRRQMEMLASGCQTFFLYLFLFFFFLLLCARYFSRSVAHSRGFSERDN